MPRRRRAPLYSCFALAALLAAACSAFSSADNAGAKIDAGAPDDASPGDASLDGGAVPPACDLQKPFGAPSPVSGGVSSAQNDDGIWLLDPLTAYLSSTRPDGAVAYRIFSTTRPNLGAAWGPAALVNLGGDADVERGPVLTGDGLTLYFFRGSGGPTTSFVAKRTALAAPFDPPIELGEQINDGSKTNTITWAAPDGSALLLSSSRGGDIDIYRVTVTSDSFGTPTAVDSLNSPGSDYAVFTPDELQAFVGSNPNDGGTTGGLLYASRARKEDRFSAPVPIDSLAAAVGALPSWVSPDGCTLYYHQPTLPFGKYVIFVASRLQ